MALLKENINNLVTDDLDKRNQNWTTIDNSLELKADKTYVDSQDELKADKTEVDASLELKVDKVTGKQLSTEDYTSAEKTKLSGIATNANNYSHPTTHSPSIIVQDTNNRFVTDAEKSAWNGKQNALGYTPLNSTLKGAANGIAELDSNGRVPSSQLPSYVDDVLEYASKSNFPATGESGKIYISADTNLTYRWSGTGYVEISASLALGETSSTAFVGDKGKVAYEHSQTAHAPSNATANDTDANLRNRSTHTGTQSADTITDGTNNKAFTAAEKTKLSGIDINANNYSHPTTHPASMIIESSTKRFVSDSEKSTWNSKSDTDTTYSEITTAEIDTGTASTLRTITGRRVKYILDKVQGWISGLTKSDVGLGNVDNTSDLNKPISTAQQTALSLKADKTYVDSLALGGEGSIDPALLESKADITYVDSQDALKADKTEVTSLADKVPATKELITVAEKNQHYPIIMNSTGEILGRHLTHVWRGSSYAAWGDSLGVGTNALQNNTGWDTNGFGEGALANNTGPSSNGFGHQSLSYNEGANSSGFGHQSLSYNTGSYSSGFGNDSLYNNEGENSNGFGYYSLYYNAGENSNGFGNNSLSSNMGANSNGFGQQSLSYNTGPSSNGFGHQSLSYNEGENSNGFGAYSLQSNIGANSNGFGAYSLQSNTGNNSNGFGHQSLLYNAGENSNGFGNNSLYYNTGNNSNGFGNNSLYFNTGANNTAIGGNANAIFIENTAGSKTFDATAVDFGDLVITIPGHGFGANNTMATVNYSSTTGTEIGGLVVGTPYTVYILDENIIAVMENMTSQGTGTHTFTPSANYSNTTCLGANTVPNKSNQVVLGDIAVDTIKMGGTKRTPASETAEGVKGETCWDENYFYVCVEDNRWKRTKLRDSQNELTKSDVGLSNVDNVKQMPISGGVLENYREKLVTLSDISTAITINLSLGNVFRHPLISDTTYSITNAVSGQAHSFTLIVEQGAFTKTLTFPASVKWQGGEIPDMSTAEMTYILTFMTVDGGTTWFGMFGGEF